MSHRIFIDGQAGTTGLEIHTRLRGQPDLELLEIDPQQRKDPAARAALLNAADVVVLCLPDDAARDAIARIDDPAVRILDASSAHRTTPGWVYGLPELAATQREAIRGASRVANPGCYPTGFLLLLRPLVDAGAIPATARLTIHALSGYSGGGRSLVDRYASAEADELLAPRSYALSLDHKHRPEMRALAGLAHPPLFSPMVGPFERGMLVHVPLPADRGAPDCDARLEAGACGVRLSRNGRGLGSTRRIPGLECQSLRPPACWDIDLRRQRLRRDLYGSGAVDDPSDYPWREPGERHQLPNVLLAHSLGRSNLRKRSNPPRRDGFEPTPRSGD